MLMLFTHTNTKTWIDVINDLLSNHNNSYHRSIKMTPIAASQKKNEKNYITISWEETEINKTKIYRVRISKKWKDIAKRYLSHFTEKLLNSV